MSFCPNCDNVLDISKNPPKKTISFQQAIKTPSDVSDVTDSKKNDSDGDETNSTQSEETDNSDSKKEQDKDKEKEQNKEDKKDPTLEKIDEIINKIANEETLTEDDLNEVRFEQLNKIKAYQKLDKKKKSIVQSKLSKHVEKMDDVTSAYWICKNCKFSKGIENGALVLSRISTESSAEYINFDKFKNRVYSKILPITRNYICINDKCDTNKKGADRKPREAVFFRTNGNMQVWYACKVCTSYWKGE